MSEPYYPEHEKLARIRDQSQVVGEFVDWLSSQGLTIARRHKCDLCVDAIVGKSAVEWCADFFEIDLKKLESEKALMLDRIREGRA